MDRNQPIYQPIMDNNIFATTEQETQRAANELSEIKVQIRALVGKLNQIERRLKAIAPLIEIKKVTKTKQDSKQFFSDEQLKVKFEDLSQAYKTDVSSALTQLQSSDGVELLAIANYVGCTVSKKPSHNKLIELIVGRLKESKLLNDGFGT